MTLYGVVQEINFPTPSVDFHNRLFWLDLPCNTMILTSNSTSVFFLIKCNGYDG
jgi:hypothetical protein